MPKPLPHPADRGHRLGGGLGRRRQDAPAVAEQLGKAGFGSGMLGAGDRVAGNEMHTRRDMRPQIADHGLLDRADIGQDRAVLQRRPDPPPDFGIGGERRRDDHEIGTRDRLCRVVASSRRQSPAAAPRPKSRPAERKRRCGLGAVAAQRPGERGPDQPDPDQRHPVEELAAHRPHQIENDSQFAGSRRYPHPPSPAGLVRPLPHCGRGAWS